MGLFVTIITSAKPGTISENNVYIETHSSPDEALGSGVRQARERFPDYSIIGLGVRDISEEARAFAALSGGSDAKAD